MLDFFKYLSFDKFCGIGGIASQDLCCAESKIPLNLGRIERVKYPPIKNMHMGRKYRDESWLREQYVEKEKTMAEIASECDVSSGAIGNWIDKYNIPTRSQGPQHNRLEKLRDESWLREKLHEEKYTVAELVNELGYESDSTVRKYMREYDIQVAYKNEDVLKSLIVDKEMEASEIADEFNIIEQTVKRWADKFDIPRHKYCSITPEEEIHEELQRIESEKGSVSSSEIKESNILPEPKSVSKRFGENSLVRALEYFDIEPDEETKKFSDLSIEQYSRNGIIQSFEDFVSSQEQKDVTIHSYTSSGIGPNSSQAICNNVSSVENLVSEAEIDNKKLYSPKYWSREDLLDGLRQLEEPVSAQKVRNEEKIPGVKYYREYFGSLKEAYEESGVTYNEKTYTVEEIVDALRSVSDERLVSTSDVKSMDMSTSPIKRVGDGETIQECIESLGFEYKSEVGPGKEYSENELLKVLQEVHDNHGEVKIDMLETNEELPSYMTYIYRFGSWANAKREAGLDDDIQSTVTVDKDKYKDWSKLYGRTFDEIREQVRERDNYLCTECGVEEDSLEEELHVHHKKPVKAFDDPKDAHTVDNCVSLCRSCHYKVEKEE
jgi:transposase